MTEAEALKVITPLVIAFPFKDDEVDLWMIKMQALSDVEAALKTADAMIDEVESLRAPQWSVFKKLYERWYARLEEQRAEKRLQLESGQGRMDAVTPRQGRQIAGAAYEKQYKRKPQGDIFALPNPEFVPTATQTDVDRALRVIEGGYVHDGRVFSRYAEVLRAFDGHHLTARAALAALEGARKIHHHPNGVLILLPATP